MHLKIHGKKQTNKKLCKVLMGGLDTHAYMPGEWSAGLREVAGGPGCSMAPTCICFLPILDYLWSRPTTSSCLFYSRKQYRRLMGGLDTHAYMPGEWSAGLLEVAGGADCSNVLTWTCFLPTLDYLGSRPSTPSCAPWYLRIAAEAGNGN